MIEITDTNRFGKVIADALAKVEATVTDAKLRSRWINAISKAAVEIERNGVFMTWQDESNSLLIWSQKSNNIYTANGVCQCRAFAEEAPCYHRAAARLVRLYLESEMSSIEYKNDSAATLQEMNNAPYLKRYIPAERVGNIRI